MTFKLNGGKSQFQEKILYIGFSLYCLTTVLGTLITKLFSLKIVLLIYAFTIIFFIVGVVNNKGIIIKKCSLRILGGWVFFIIAFMLFRNQLFAHNMWKSNIQWLYFASMIFIIPLIEKKNYYKFLKILCAFTFINVFFTYFFLIFKNKYNIVHKLWGMWPPGSRNGQTGWRSGISNHYSQNAMVIAVCFFIFVALFYSVYNTNGLKKHKNKLKKEYFVFCFITFLALLLTNKRGHLLFGICALLMCYYFLQRKHKIITLIKILFIGVAIVIAFIILSTKIPFLNELYQRFLTMGEDENTTSRFEFWELCIKNFKSHPILGIGWGGYLFEYNKYLRVKYDVNPNIDRTFMYAHNVYFQLLCETGLVGTLVYIFNVGTYFITTIRTVRIRNNIHPQEKSVLVFALILQIFYILYSMTGNCLYDNMFSYYVVAVGFTIGVYSQEDNLHNKIKYIFK